MGFNIYDLLLICGMTAMLAHGELVPEVVARDLPLAVALMLALGAEGWRGVAGALRRLFGGDGRATLVAAKASFASRRWGPRAAPP